MMAVPSTAASGNSALGGIHDALKQRPGVHVDQPRVGPVPLKPHQEIGDLFAPHRPSAGVDGYPLPGLGVAAIGEVAAAAVLVGLGADDDQRCPWLPDREGFHWPGLPIAARRSESASRAWR